MGNVSAMNQAVPLVNWVNQTEHKRNGLDSCNTLGKIDGF